MRKTIDELQQRTAQYAVEHITGRGMHAGIALLWDPFNELCEAMGDNKFNSDDIGLERSTTGLSGNGAAEGDFHQDKQRTVCLCYYQQQILWNKETHWIYIRIRQKKKYIIFDNCMHKLNYLIMAS